MFFFLKKCLFFFSLNILACKRTKQCQRPIFRYTFLLSVVWSLLSNTFESNEHKKNKKKTNVVLFHRNAMIALTRWKAYTWCKMPKKYMKCGEFGGIIDYA